MGMLCALVKKSFYLLSNSHELAELSASDVPFAATMRDFPRGRRGKANKLKLGLVHSDDSYSGPFHRGVLACDTRSGRVLTIHILRGAFKAAGKMSKARYGKTRGPPSFTELEESFHSGGGDLVGAALSGGAMWQTDLSL